MTHGRPANELRHRHRRTDMDYKAMTKALLDQIEDSHILRMIYEIVHSIAMHPDHFAH